MQHYGYIWLNRIFVKRPNAFRLWKTSDIRVSTFELIVVIVMMLLLCMLMSPVVALLMQWSVIADRVNLWVTLPALIIPAWRMGRSLAKASPYHKLTGENIFDWMIVARDRSDTVLGRLVGHRVAVNEATTWVNGRPQTVEVVEWVGSARAPVTAPTKAHMSDDDTIAFALRSRTEPTSWVAEMRERSRERGGEVA